MAGHVSPEVEEICKGFIITDDNLCDISDRLLVSMKKGLSKSGHPTAAVKCFPTYVQDFPTGNEQGHYMALDLGGTNFRVLKVTLEKHNKFEMIKEKYEFPEEMKVGTGEKLFDYVAECVDDFCHKHKLKTEKNILLPMGFTFSFPIDQQGLNKGILIKWTKGFQASDVEGKDVVALLKEAFTRKKLNDILTPVAILNDTTGTLMSCAWEQPDTRIGLIVVLAEVAEQNHNKTQTRKKSSIFIKPTPKPMSSKSKPNLPQNQNQAKTEWKQILNRFTITGFDNYVLPYWYNNFDSIGVLCTCIFYDFCGQYYRTGSNACYTEKLENIETAVNADRSKPYMVINIEWGNFGADGAIDDFLTEFDREIHADSFHKKNQIFEKCISGRYMGEIMRRILLKLIRKKLIFDGNGAEKLSKQFIFRTEFITNIERDPPGVHNNAKAALAELGIQNPSKQDLINLRYVSECISGRSAAFVSAGIATLINKMNINTITVGVDGTVYRQHPRYKSIMEEKIKCLIKPELNFRLMLSEDGSGRGAAFVAAVLHEQIKNT